MKKNNISRKQLLNFSELIQIPVIISSFFNPSEIIHINKAGSLLIKKIFNSTTDFINQAISFSGLFEQIININELKSIYTYALKKKKNLDDVFVSFTDANNTLYSLLLKISVVNDEFSEDKYIITSINDISEIFNYRAELSYSQKFLEGFIDAFARDRMTYLLAYGHEETVKHLMEVREFSKLIAQKIMHNTDIPNKGILEYSKITPLYIKILEISALLHDFGKIHHEIHPLIKLPRKLRIDEFEKVKKHTVFGSELIGDNEMLHMCRLVAKFHHEKWDGSGYPDGLEGNEIPLSARIVAFADMFSALRNERAYKKAITDIDEIIKIFYECERYYDPVIFKLGLELIPEMLEKISRLESQYKNFKITSDFFIAFLQGSITL